MLRHGRLGDRARVHLDERVRACPVVAEPAPLGDQRDAPAVAERVPRGDRREHLDVRQARDASELLGDDVAFRRALGGGRDVLPLAPAARRECGAAG
jgi:hypothetical protein